MPFSARRGSYRSTILEAVQLLQEDKFYQKKRGKNVYLVGLCMAGAPALKMKLLTRKNIPWYRVVTQSICIPTILGTEWWLLP